MSVITKKFIHRQDLWDNPNWLFVFGDNMHRKGFGGQAKAMRGEPNAVGIVTKRLPTHGDHAYLKNSDLEDPAVRGAIDAAFERLRNHLRAGGIVVLPEAGVGGGLAHLPEKAPRIDRYIKEQLKALSVR